MTDFTTTAAKEYARKYLERGWRPIPLDGKNPAINGRDWQGLEIAESDIEDKFDGLNVGVVLGEASGKLVDVDLDHPLAVELAPDYLPPTGAKFGRASKQDSHWVYYAEGAETEQHKGGKHGMIVELRSTGGQTMFPGSCHPGSGEPVEWSSDEEPATVDSAELAEAVAKLAANIKNRLGIADALRSENPYNAAGGDGFNLPPVSTSENYSVEERARRYLAKIPPAVSGQDGHGVTFKAAQVLVRGFCLSDQAALQLLAEWNNQCQPPWSEKELRHKVQQAREKGQLPWGYIKDRPNDGWDTPIEWPSDPHEEPPDRFDTERLYLDLDQLIETYPEEREPVVDWLFRRGDVVNLIAAPKIGKSWLAMGLAVCVATGRDWLGLETTQGKVLYIDNELHATTLSDRYQYVTQAMSVSPQELAPALKVKPFRGALEPIDKMGAYFLRLQEEGPWSLIVLDALYRFLPEGASENAANDMTQIYNQLAKWAELLQCAIVCVHHTSKGDQSQKDVVDVGAGSNAQSRAADAHIILRPHEQGDGDLAVMDVVVRSFGKSGTFPLSLKWEWPVWLPKTGVPAQLRSPLTRGAVRNENRDQDGMELFLKVMRSHGGTCTQSQVRGRTGMGQGRVARLACRLEGEGHIEVCEPQEGDRRNTIRYVLTDEKSDYEAAESPEPRKERNEDDSQID